jgi:phospholipase C
VRPARALPYALDARGVAQLGDGSVRIEFSNTGERTAVFQVRSGNLSHAPRTYTVQPGASLSGVWSIAATGATDYDLSVSGPNGFLRTFKGSIAAGGARLDVQSAYDAATQRITLTISNPGPHATAIDVLNDYDDKTISEHLDAGASVSRRWSLARFDGWYDFLITMAGDAGFEYELAGHLETGKDSTSDPAMGGVL